MKITVLVDNLAEQAGLFAEHGFAVHLESSGKRILLDTGYSGTALLANAQRLKIDLSLVDELVISHGHSDHTGGLEAFLAINQRARIRLSAQAWQAKYKGQEAFIGIPFAREVFEERVVEVEQASWIASDIRIIPAVPITNQSDTHFEGMFVKDASGFKQDEFFDELTLLIENSECYGIISACSHRGITNIFDEAKRLTGEYPAFALAGMHLRHSSPEQIDPIAENLANKRILQLYAAHCTGPLATSILRKHLPGRVEWTSCGKEIEF